MQIVALPFTLEWHIDTCTNHFFFLSNGYIQTAHCSLSHKGDCVENLLGTAHLACTAQPWTSIILSLCWCFPQQRYYLGLKKKRTHKPEPLKQQEEQQLIHTREDQIWHYFPQWLVCQWIIKNTLQHKCHSDTLGRYQSHYTATGNGWHSAVHYNDSSFPEWASLGPELYNKLKNSKACLKIE